MNQTLIIQAQVNFKQFLYKMQQLTLVFTKYLLTDITIIIIIIIIHEFHRDASLETKLQGR